MQRKNRKLIWSLSLSVLAIGALITLFPRTAFNQNVPSAVLVGTWNLSGTVAGGSESPFIAVMTFNFGGTTVEFDTGGTNSSASPGQSITLGKWRQTGLRTFSFQQQNYDYDSSGSLAGLTIESVDVTLDASPHAFTGTGSVSFYSCTVSLCPGPLVAGPTAVNLTGRRF